MCMGLHSRKDDVMASRQDYTRVLQMMLGQGAPNPYMGLDIRGRINDWWNNFSQNNLPQAPGMQKELFQEWYPDDNQAKYDLMMKYYNY